jgi:hypothetical protein
MIFFEFSNMNSGISYKNFQSSYETNIKDILKIYELRLEIFGYLTVENVCKFNQTSKDIRKILVVDKLIFQKICFLHIFSCPTFSTFNDEYYLKFNDFCCFFVNNLKFPFENHVYTYTDIFNLIHRFYISNLTFKFMFSHFVLNKKMKNLKFQNGEFETFYKYVKNYSCSMLMKPLNLNKKYFPINIDIKTIMDKPGIIMLFERYNSDKEFKYPNSKSKVYFGTIHLIYINKLPFELQKKIYNQIEISDQNLSFKKYASYLISVENFDFKFPINKYYFIFSSKDKGIKYCGRDYNYFMDLVNQ